MQDAQHPLSHEYVIARPVYMRPPKEEFDNVMVLFVYRGTSAYFALDNAKLEAFDGD